MESRKANQTERIPKNPVHQMKIYEEFVKKENSYSYRNRTEEFSMNPNTCNSYYIFNLFSG